MSSFDQHVGLSSVHPQGIMTLDLERIWLAKDVSSVSVCEGIMRYHRHYK